MDEFGLIAGYEGAVFIQCVRGDQHIIRAAGSPQRFEHRTHFRISPVGIAIEWQYLCKGPVGSDGPASLASQIFFSTFAFFRKSSR